MLPGWGLRLSLLSRYSQDQEGGGIVSAAVYQYGHLGTAASGEYIQHGLHEVADVDGVPSVPQWHFIPTYILPSFMIYVGLLGGELGQ